MRAIERGPLGIRKPKGAPCGAGMDPFSMGRKSDDFPCKCKPMAKRRLIGPPQVTALCENPGCKLAKRMG